ncbi:MAG: hypothetical protein SGJ00_15165 [bacterium]|nr:hypothetical protein [bacterium]
MLFSLCTIQFSISQIVPVGSAYYTNNFSGADAAGRNFFPTGMPC